MSRNIGTGLPLNAALYPRRAQFSSASWQKPEVMDSPLIFQNTMDIMHTVLPSTTVIYGHPASFPMKK
jgi:hypothetical protein